MIAKKKRRYVIPVTEEMYKALPPKPAVGKSLSLVVPAIIKGIAGIRGVPDGSGPEGKGPTGLRLGGCPKREDYESDEEYQNALEKWKKQTGKSLKLVIEKSMTWSGYKLQGRTEFQGLKISIENRKGSVREGVDPDGRKWKTKFKYPYGYIREFGSGEDGDHIDCYLGPNKDSRLVAIVRQQNPINKTYDEDKVMLGFNSPGEAKKAYLDHYDNPNFFGGMDVVDIDKFKEMLKGNYESSGGRLKIKKACGRAKRIVHGQYPGLSEEDEKFWKIAQKVDTNIKGGK